MQNYKFLLEEKLKDYLPTAFKDCFFEFPMSGTSSIDYAINEILAISSDIKDAYLPDFGCYSLELPFKKRNLKITKYHVKFDSLHKKFIYDLPSVNEGIILICDYFCVSDEIKKNDAKNLFYIKDVTHTFMNINYDENINYYVASLRKWFHTTDGGLIISKRRLKNKLKSENRLYNFYKKLDYFFSKHKKFPFFNYFAEHYAKKSDYIADNRFSGYSVSNTACKEIIYINFDTMKTNRRNNYLFFKSLLSEKHFLYPENEMLLMFCVFLKNKNFIEHKISELRALGIRCAQMWEENKNSCSYNICFDLNEKYNTTVIEKIKKILLKE